MIKVLIIYETQSGNTQEVAELIEGGLVSEGFQVTTYRVGTGVLPTPADYDLILFGTYTWKKGAVPEEVKDLIYDFGYKPKNVYIFGTGDTQFGGDALFCRAVDKLAKFYDSQYPVLKVEQSPRGAQEQKVMDWTRGVSEKWNG